MHEIGLVDDIICTINAKLKEAKAGSRLKKINIAIGELEHVSPGHFEFHFRERTKDTPLAAVELDFKKIKAKFKCKNCQAEFFCVGDLECPVCNSKIADIISGSGIYVDSIEIA